MASHLRTTDLPCDGPVQYVSRQLLPEIPFGGILRFKISQHGLDLNQQLFGL
jgi:hypothetical protein